MNRGHLFLFVTSVLFLPFIASAQIVITDVTYDPVGADTGHEYIELLNTGTSSVRLTDFKLRTNGANHKIVTLLGDGVLVSQARAAITQDAGLFGQDNSSFVGVVFHSSFSLTNTSGTVEIIDKSGTVIATTSYQAPPPAPAPPKQKTTKAKKTSKSVSNNTSPLQDVFDTTTQVEPAAAPEVAADATPVSGGSSVWLVGAIVLASAASIATFYARHTAKREWDIVEENDETV